MKKHAILFFLIFMVPVLSLANEGVEQRMDKLFGEHKIYKDFFFQFKDTVLNNNRKQVNEMIRFPITVHGKERKYVVKNSEEFLKLYDSIFSNNILTTIKHQRFEDLFVKWSGVMIGDGEIWYEGICQDDNCKKVTIKVKSFYNPFFFRSEKGQKAFEDLLKNERSKLHKSLWNFIEPVLLWHTKKYIIRIDRTGDDDFRYAAWNINSDPSQKPNIILNNGNRINDGSGGNHFYEFKNGPYKYICSVIVLGTSDSPPGSIEVLKNDKSILYQTVIKALSY